MSRDDYQPINVHHRPDPEAYSAVSASFLQTLPSVMLRGPIYLVFLLLASGLAYSCVGRVESKVTTGLLVRGEESVLESPVAGEVSFVHVDAGDEVDALTPLLSLFAPSAAADVSELSRLRTDSGEVRIALRDLRLGYGEVIRITRGLSSTDHELRFSNFPPELSLPPDLVGDAGSALMPAAKPPLRYAALVESYRVRQTGALRDLVRARVELVRAQARHAQSVELYARRVISEPDFAASQQQLAGSSAEVERLSGSIQAGFHAMVGELHAERDRLVERLRGLDGSIERVQLASSEIVVDRQHVHIRSRYPGVVTRLLVRPLEPVAPGSELVSVVRSDLPKYGTVLVPNSAIGKVAVGQRVFVKFAAYPFQEYGVQTGRVVSIAPEQVTLDELGHGYEARVAFDAVRRGITLQYGMQGTAEIATGKRRMIELFLPPTAKLFAALGG